MRTATGVVFTLVVLVGLAYTARAFLPSSQVIALNWNSQQIFVPLNIAGFWACAISGVFLSTVQMVRGMLRDARRLM